MLTVKVTINVAGQTVPQVIPVVQGDTGRAIFFTLADFTIPTGATATYYVQKPSGEAVYNAATIDGNTVLVELTAQSIIEVGDNYGQVRIEKDDEVVTSFDFILLVKPFRGIDATQSTTEMNIFDKAVEQAEEAIDEAKDAALEEIAEASENIAEEFDASNSYLAGEYTIYQGKLYKFTSAHTGAWTGSDASEVTVGDELTSLKDDFESLQTDLAQTTAEALSAYVTDTATGAIASFPDGADGVPVKSLVVDIEPVQSGTGDPSPTNIRPISGHTQAKVTRTGKNLFNKNDVTSGYRLSTNGEPYVDANYFISAYIPVTVGKHYTKNSPTADAYHRICIYSSDKVFLSKVDDANTITVSNSNAAYIRFCGLRTELDTTQFEEGTGTAYAPYTIDTYTISLDGTRYGGTLDVTTGVLTVDSALATITGDSITSIGTTSTSVKYIGGSLSPAGMSVNGISNQYKCVNSVAPQGSTGIRGVGNSWYIYDDRFTDMETAKSLLNANPVQMVYTLTEPITLTLTEQEVTTLLGQNNVWADCGDTTVEYRADTKLYIQKVLNA